jgi:FAD/FMN-containing dehydrogenase
MCRSKYNEKVRYACPVREHTAGFEHYFQLMGGSWAIKQQPPFLSTTYLEFLRLLKRTIDPNNIMNPGLIEA